MLKRKTIDSYFGKKRSESNEEEITNPVASVECAAPQSIDDLSHKQVEINFEGIEKLERDSGIRPQIWQYAVNQQDEVRRAYAILGPMQPKLNEYKSCDAGTQQRRFQYSWFADFGCWLEYSESNHRAYCFVCFLFGKQGTNRSGSDVFTIHSFQSWKRVKNGKKCSFHTHMGTSPCSQHNNAMKSYIALKNAQGHVANVIQVHTRDEKERSRLRLKVSIAAVKWLAEQGCSFRGHDERPQSKNRGNFLELLQLLADMNPDIDKVVLENAPATCKWNSPGIQKEILSIYATMIRNQIREEIADSKFSIIVDESCDVAKQEQMALILRFVDAAGVLQERFFDLIHVRDAKAITLKEHLTHVLAYHSLNVKNIRGQSYDGGSNMKGEINGLQALFLQECSYAYYIHCYAHRLQLALVAVSKDISAVFKFFEKLNFIINIVDSSAKRHDELYNARVAELSDLLENDMLETGRGANQIRSLHRPGDTRWSSHLSSIRSIMEMFTSISAVLDNISNDPVGSIRAGGETASDYLFSFEFVFILLLMNEVLGTTNLLCRELQKKKQDIVNAVNAVSITRQLLQKMRDNG